MHPVIDYNYIVDAPVVGGELSFAGNALSLSRSDGVAGVGDQEMARASLEVNWRRRLTDSLGITYTPFGELRGDLLQFNNYRDAVTAQIIEDDAVARGLAAGGVTVTYPWIANTPGASHIIEPIGQVIARQASINQNEFRSRTRAASCSTTRTCSTPINSPAGTAWKLARAPTSACSTHSSPGTADTPACLPAKLSAVR